MLLKINIAKAMEFNPATYGVHEPKTFVPPNFRKPRRLSITVPDLTYRMIVECSREQGRSISNLAAFLLEKAITTEQKPARGELFEVAQKSQLSPNKSMNEF